MRIGPYELLGEIGRGGMGVVHRARSPEGADVALKLLTRASNADAAARFDRERRLLASLGEAQGFVALLDAGMTPHGPYLVMPFVEGGTLRARLKHGPLPIDDALALGRSLAGAIGRAHSLGIVHRDLKPENVLFTGDGRALVADLGLAKHFASDAPGASQSVALSHAGALLGTAGYMPHEQVSDASSVGPPADVFALGAILHECLAGEPAFPGATALEVFTRVDRGTTVSLRSLRKETPPWLEAVVERALARDPEQRFPDGAALARALDAGGRTGSGGRLAVLALAGVVAAIAIAFALRRPTPKPPATPPPEASATRVPPPDLATRLRRWKNARIPSAELSEALRDFPGAGEELASAALTCGITGAELSPEVRRAFRARGNLAHAMRAVDLIEAIGAGENGTTKVRSLLDGGLGGTTVEPPLRDAWRTLTTDDQLARTYPALLAPIFSSLETMAVNELAYSTLRKGVDVSPAVATLSRTMLGVMALGDLPPVLRGCLAAAMTPTDNFAPKREALEAAGLELERRKETAPAAILLCSAVHAGWQGEIHDADPQRPLAAKAHRLALESAEREPDPGRKHDFFDLACWALLDGYMTAGSSPVRLAAFRAAFDLARRENLAGQTMAARMIVDELVQSKQCARVDELLPGERAEWLPEILCLRARAALDSGADATARELLARARALARERPREPRSDALIEGTARYLDAGK